MRATPLVLASSLLIGACAPGSPPPPAREGGAAAAFEGTDPAGRPVRYDPAGTPAVLAFWATWCPTCVEETRILSALAREHGGNLRIVGVCVDKDAARAGQFVAEHAIPYEVVTDGDLAISGRYAVHRIPTLVVVGRDGIVRFRGGRPDGAFDRAVREVLQ